MNKQKQAFTLVELIVVITILAILGTIAFISLQGYSKDARDSIRISDISNIKTSLELFHLDSGKYPLPDDNQIVDYGTETLWYQGNFGSTVISSLSRSISEVPIDPLTEKKYVFSVANNKNEFEILSLLEGDSLTLNNLSQANAASLEVTPKIDGTYNRVFIKTANYIVPVPSIINTEVGNITMTLDSNNISSQVINGGENIPEQGNVISNTGALSGLVLSVYTGSININTSNAEKEIVIGKIKDTYSGSVLANSDIYEYILNTSGTEGLVKLANSIVLKDDTTEVTSTPSPYENCIGQNSPLIGDLSIIATTTYNLCDTPDIIVCSGPKSGYTIAACNVGTATAGITIASYGDYFQFGRNDPYPTWTNGQAGYSYDWKASGGLDGGSANDWGVFEANKLTTTYNNPLGSTNTLLMKGPCEGEYHIPTDKEWDDLVVAGSWGTSGTNMSNDLKLPEAKMREWNNPASLAAFGRYWSSSPNATGGLGILFYSSSISLGTNYYRASGIPVRCFKN